MNTIAFCCLAAIERADHAAVRKGIEQLRYMAEELDNIDARVNLHEMSAKYALKTGAPRESLDHIEKGIAAAVSGGQGPMLIYFHGMKGYALLLLGDPEACGRSLEQSEELMRQEGLVMPHFRTRYTMARLALELWRLESLRRYPLARGKRRQARRTSRSAAQALACSKRWMGDRLPLRDHVSPDARGEITFREAGSLLGVGMQEDPQRPRRSAALHGLRGAGRSRHEHGSHGVRGVPS